jgi:hypothetical protein
LTFVIRTVDDIEEKNDSSSLDELLDRGTDKEVICNESSVDNIIKIITRLSEKICPRIVK